MELALITLSIGLILFFAYLFSALFSRFQIPDVFFLLIIGLVLGPITNVVDVEQFGVLGDLFATLTLLIILFEAGLDIKIKKLLSTAPRATLQMFLTLLLSIIIVVPFGMLVFGLTLVESILVGIVVGGVSAGISIPVVKKLPVLEKTKTMLVLESNINDIVTVSIFLAIVAFLESGVFSVQAFMASFGTSFVISLSIGVVIAFVWSQLLNKMRSLENSIFMTPALVLTVFGATELLGMSGMIAAFAFGITLGNLQYVRLSKLPRVIEFRKFRLTKWERNMFNDFVFLLKTYFFIYIGLSITLENTLIIGIGALVTVLLFGARSVAVKLSADPDMPAFDKEVLAKLMPKGLVGAALVVLVDSQAVQDVAYAIILFSIIFTSILIFLLPNKKEPAPQSADPVNLQS